MRKLNKKKKLYIAFTIILTIICLLSIKSYAASMPSLSVGNTLNIGESSGPNDYFIRNESWLYCVSAADNTSNGVQHTYKVKYRVSIDGKNATSSAGKTNSNKLNAKLAYILAVGGYAYGNTGTEGGKVVQNTSRQRALWAVWNSWIKNSGRDLGINNFYHSGNEGQTPGNYTNQILDGADTYANNLSNSTGNESGASISGSNNITMDGLNGGYRATFDGKINKITVSFVDNSSNLEITSKSSSFPIYEDSSKTKQISISEIKSNTRFYFTNNTKKEIKSIKLDVTKPGNGEKIYKATIYLLQCSGSQDLIAVDYSSTTSGPTSASLTVSVNYTTSTVEIEKRGSYQSNGVERTEIVNAYFKVYCKENGKWLKGNANGTKTYVTNFSEATQYETTDGSLTINGLIGHYNYYFLEVGVKNSAYKNSNNIPEIYSVSGGSLLGTSSTNAICGRSYWSVVRYISIQESNHIIITDRKYRGSLTITKKDRLSNTKISNVSLKVYGILSSGTKGWLQSDGSLGNYSSSKTYITNSEGALTISSLLPGNYYIYEIGTNSNYNLEDQRVNRPDSNDPNGFAGRSQYNSAVYLGYKTIALKDNKSDTSSNTVVNSVSQDYYQYGPSKLTINKVDYDTNIKLNGFKFAIFMQSGSDSGWLGYDTSTKKVTYGNNWSKAYQFTTGTSYCNEGQVTGGFTLNHLRAGNYYVYEVGTNGEYNLSDQIGYSTNNGTDAPAESVLNGFNSYQNGCTSVTFSDGSNYAFYRYKKTDGTVGTCNYVHLDWYTGVVTSTDGTKYYGTNHATYTAKNIQGNLTIIKTDGTYKQDLGLTEDIYLKDAEIKIYGTNLKDGSKGWLKRVPISGGNYRYEYTTYEQATGFKTDDKGTIEIRGIRHGTYYIYETKTPDGYNIKMQEGYHQASEGSSDIGNNVDWVFLGSATISAGNSTVEKQVINNKYIELKGKVWVDELDTKGNTYDSLYNSSSNDELLKDITVNLYNRKTPNKPIASTSTNGQGEYVFNESLVGRKLSYWEMAYYYVEFIYDNKQYITVNPFQGGDNFIPVNSKAQAEEITNEELRDENLTGIEKPYPGRAITYKGTGNSFDYKKIVEDNASADITQKLLTAYYNTSTCVIENINLGLVHKTPTDHTIGETLEYVKIVRGNYTFTYKYGEDAVTEQGDKQSTVSFQNSKKSFTQYIYPSDIKYNFANENLSNSDKYKIYVVYKINIKNFTTTNNEDLYVEKALYLDDLTNTYDKSRYQISNDVLEGDDSNISKDFGLWSDTSNSGTATFNINASDKKYKVGNSGLAPLESENTYIEFRVTDEALTKLVTEEQLAESPTIAKSKGYHIYTRKVKNWKNEDIYVFESLREERENGSLYLRWRLSDTRIISGKTFEDTKVDKLDGEDDNSRKDQRVGDGKYTESSEKTLTDVIVSLIDADTGNIANLYDGELTQDVSTNKWKSNKKLAVTKVDENGNYSLPGVVPGRYYLKFTYGDGKVEFTDLNGTEIDNVATKIKDQSSTINSNYYKSTILTGSAKNATVANEKTWYIGSINEGVYSIATDSKGTYYDENGNVKESNIDIITSRTTSNNEINYTSIQDKVVIDAISPIMDIQFEYIENKEIAKNDANTLRTNCTGMSFGIIERPHTEIELEKTISNVKLTLSNGTTIINGNPQDTKVSQYLTSMNTSYAKIEMDSSYLYGSTVTITYKLTAINKSELDYATEDYYILGNIDDPNKLVKTTVTKIIDYLSDPNWHYVSVSENATLSDNSSNYDPYGKEGYFKPGVISTNRDYSDKLLITSTEELSPQSSHTGISSTNYTVTVNKLLSNSDDNLGLESYSEIIGLKNITFTAQYSSNLGNYNAGDIKSYVDGGTSEVDNANSVIAITPSTGENRSYTIYIIAGAVLIVLAGGIVIIKKFVL